MCRLFLLVVPLLAVPASALTFPELEQLVDALPAMQTVQLQRSQPTRLDVVNCEGLSDSRKIAVMLLQGLANRGGARLYLRGLHDFNNRADDWWLERLRDHYGVPSTPTTWEQAFGQYGAGCGGLVVWDDKLPATQNVAAMLAGFRSWLACAPADVEAVKAATALPIAVDLRGVWKDHLASQRWALQHLVPKLPRDDIGCICARAALTTDPRLCQDWLVMRGGVMVDLSSSRPEERALKDQFYKQIRPRAVVWGWVTYDGEVPHVEHATISGLQVLCTSNSPNLSVFSQLVPHRTAWQQPHSPPHPEIGKKLYVTFVISDGDAPPILQTRYWYRWDEPARGKVPVGWELQPYLAVAAPILLEYYYQTATPLDRFVCAPPYVLPTRLPDQPSFMADAAALSAPCDLNIVYTGNDRLEQATAERWAQYFPLSQGYVYGWGADAKRPPYLYAGRPHIHYGVIMDPPEKHGPEYYDGIADQMAAYARLWGMPSVLFVHLSNYHAGPNDVLSMAQRLQGLPVEIVPMDTAFEIARNIMVKGLNPQWGAH